MYNTILTFVFLTTAVDYEPFQSFSVSLGPEADTGSTLCVNITLTDDDTAEPDERFSVEVEAVSDDVVIIGASDEAYVTIIDHSDRKLCVYIHHRVYTLHKFSCCHECDFVFSTDTLVGFEQESYVFVGSEMVPVCAVLLENRPDSTIALTLVELLSNSERSISTPSIVYSPLFQLLIHCPLIFLSP